MFEGEPGPRASTESGEHHQVRDDDDDDDNDNDQVSTIQFVATLQAAAAELREAGFTVEIPQVREMIKLS